MFRDECKEQASVWQDLSLSLICMRVATSARLPGGRRLIQLSCFCMFSLLAWCCCAGLYAIVGLLHLCQRRVVSHFGVCSSSLHALRLQQDLVISVPEHVFRR